MQQLIFLPEEGRLPVLEHLRAANKLLFHRVARHVPAVEAAGDDQLGVSIKWREVWGRAAGWAAESPIQSRDGLVSFRLQRCRCFRVHPICQIKVKRNGLKLPKIHLTLSKHFHLLDLHFTSDFCVSSHSQILKHENFPGTEFALSRQLSALHWNLPPPLLPGEGGQNLCERLSAAVAEHSLQTRLS